MTDPSGSRRPDHPQVHVVSNRLPVTWDDRSGWQRAPGGLVTALEAITRAEPVSWIGSAATASAGSGHVRPGWPHGPLHLVHLDDATVSGAVDAACNSALWPALHGLADLVRWRHDAWHHYVRYNEAFARRVAAIAGRGEQVWFHDFHLLLAPGVLRSMRPDLHIGLSLHTPVDASAVAALEHGRDIAVALRRIPLIGTQTADDGDEVRALIDWFDDPSRVGAGITATARAGVPSGRSPHDDEPLIVTSPVSVDVAGLLSLAVDPVVQGLARRHRERSRGRRLVVGIDRLDPTKAIVQRLDACDRAFARGIVDPETMDVVQIAVPSRPHVPVYAALRVEAERRLHEIRSRWQRTDGTSPVEVVFESAARRQVAALLLAADVCTVTPIRDGMNLVAKEFAVLNGTRVGSGTDDEPGVLVLGRGAGAARELDGSVVLVDGASPASVADGLARALTLGRGPRRDMAADAARRVAAWTANDWSRDFRRRLASLDAQPADHRPAHAPVEPGSSGPGAGSSGPGAGGATSGLAG